jgi:hypothetical protein
VPVAEYAVVMADEITISAADEMNALAVGTVLVEISEREGTAAAARAASDPAEFNAATERVTVALISDASRGLRRVKEYFQAIRYETVQGMCANALVNIEHVREITVGLRGRGRLPWEAEAVLNDLECHIRDIHLRKTREHLSTTPHGVHSICEPALPKPGFIVADD